MGRKKESPLLVIIIGIILVGITFIYSLGLVTGLITLTNFTLGLLIVLAIMLLVVGAIIYTVIERLKELREENEDDFSKY
ncbi:hypothetical protein [Oceanirhabdus sp. W0125-5]|uniref:hypothetical protein n=1 Tax=Oceanirhabdus sp. W0125-5 TaxID=2999116 RepID=UPI0022F2F623|nr:hypothetical protein [Oceanirhabdus sp. W0125-5]WBW94724.1 hypothetical protein OW730_13565 [Oceanirhabdus sp. W0125-5]